MSKLRNKKNRKHLITLVCLLVGMLVLTSAVYANSDDAKGYSNLKNAVKQLAFYEDNFTLEGDVKFAIDNKTFNSSNLLFLQDGENNISKSKNNTTGYASEVYVLDGQGHFYYPEENRYYSREAGYTGMPDINDPMVKKTVSFVELLGDTLVGDLKNNVVYVGEDGGTKNYTVNISGTQVPEVVNAGLSLMIGAQNSNPTTKASNLVDYEDYVATLMAYYEKETGKEFDEDGYAVGTWEVSEIEEAMSAEYNGILENKGNQGVVFVKSDGTHQYYSSYDEYFEDRMEYTVNSQNIGEMLGENPYIDSVLCNFSIDKDGKLSKLEMKASMAGKDESGEKHTISMEVKGTAKDFGSSKVVLPDFSKTKNESR